MLTAKLWRALNDPPATHPFFRRAVLLPRYSQQPHLSWASLLIGVIMGLSEYSPFFLLVLMPFILLALGLTYGLDCALRVTNAIATERENDTYELLALSPPGPLRVSWMIGVTSLYRNREFHRLRTIVKTALLVGLILILIWSFFALLLSSELITRYPQAPPYTLADILNVLFVLLALYIEYTQSTVLGCLTGMLIPTYYRNRIDANMLALGSFFLFQVGTYLLAFFLGFLVLPALYLLLNLNGDVAEILLGLLRLTLFYGVREAIIHAIWRILAERLNASRADMDFMLR